MHLLVHNYGCAMPSSPAPLEDVIAAAQPIVERIVWATVTTVGADGEPRSRLMHPVWSWDDTGPTALVTSRRTPLKLAHLAVNPVVSCFYWDPHHDTVAIDARASWVAPGQVPAAWEQIAATPAPVGFDPAMIWPSGPDDPDCAILHLSAHRVLATPAGRPGLLWRQPMDPG